MVYFGSVGAVVSDIYISFITVVGDTGYGYTYTGCEVHIGDGFGGAFGNIDFGSSITAVGCPVDESADIGEISFADGSEVHFVECAVISQTIVVFF